MTHYGENSLQTPGPCYVMILIFLVSSFPKAAAKLIPKSEGYTTGQNV